MPKKKQKPTPPAAAPQFRQGDVYVLSTETVPPGAKKVRRDAGRIVLAYGEVTGHAHAIQSSLATLWETGDGARYLEVKRTCSLQHEEHATINLPAGIFIVRRQREYQAGELPRWVAD